MTHKKAGVVLFAATALLFTGFCSCNGTAFAAGKEVTLTGEVIDSACYVRLGAKGEDHKECAVKCAKGGIPLALLEEKTGKVFMLASDREFEGPNVKFQPLEKLVAQKVVIKGKLYEKGGQPLVSISSVEVAKW